MRPTDAHRNWPLVIACIATALVAIVLYWPTLQLPLIYDTLLHIRIAGNLDLATVWLPTEAFGFYRPMTFLPLVFIRDLFGEYPNWLLHGMNIVQHAANAALLTWLAWRLWRRTGQALFSGLLFAVFPFSYQAVAVYGHNVHPALVGVVLLGLHAWLTAQRSRKRRWWAATALLFAVGLLTHESVVLFGGLAGLMQVADPRWGVQSADWRARRAIITKRRFWLPPTLFVVAGAVYLALYQLLPITRAPQAAAAADGSQKLLYLLQTAAYPITWVAGLLDSVPAVTVILVAVAVTLGLTVLAWRRYWTALLFGWGWWLAASAVIAIPLPAAYLTRGPRLLYLGSVGLALLWPILLRALFARGADGSRNRVFAKNPVSLARLLTGALVLALLVGNWVFVRDRLDAYRQLTAAAEVMQATLADRPPDDGIVAVNLPQWTAPPRNMYPLGAEFVQQLGDYLFFEEWVDVNVGGNRPNAAVRLDDLLADPGYGYAVHAQTTWADAPWDATLHLFITHYEPDGPQVTRTGWVEPDTGPGALGRVGPYELVSAAATQCEGRVSAEVRLRPIAQPEATTSLFVQALAADGTLLGQADRPPLGVRADLFAPTPKRALVDQRTVTVPTGSEAATVLLGAYDFVTGERLPALWLDGADAPDNALTIPIRACDQ